MVPWADNCSFVIVKRHEGSDHGIRGARIEPASPAVDSHGGFFDLRKITVQTDLVDRHTEGPIITKRSLQCRGVDIDVVHALFCCFSIETLVRVFVYQPDARIAIELPIAFAPGLDHPVGKYAAGIWSLGKLIELEMSRNDRLDGRVHVHR